MGLWFKLIGAFVFLILGIVVAQIWNGFTNDVRFSPFDGGSLLSPPGKIEARNVLVYDDRVVIPISGVRVVNYQGDSMIPVLDSGSNGVVVSPDSVEEIGVGDIVSFHDEKGNLIAHRVIGTDGDYFLVKGDNAPDVERILFEDIEGVLIGVIY